MLTKQAFSHSQTCSERSAIDKTRFIRIAVDTLQSFIQIGVYVPGVSLSIEHVPYVPPLTKLFFFLDILLDIPLLIERYCVFDRISSRRQIIYGTCFRH